MTRTRNNNNTSMKINHIPWIGTEYYCMNFVALTKYIALFEDGEAVHEFLGIN